MVYWSALLGACLLSSPRVPVVLSCCMPVARSHRAFCQPLAFDCRAAALPAPLVPLPPGPQVCLASPSCCLASLAASTPLRRTRLLGTALPLQSPPLHMPFDCAFASTFSHFSRYFSPLILPSCSRSSWRRASVRIKMSVSTLVRIISAFASSHILLSRLP